MLFLATLINCFTPARPIQYFLHNLSICANKVRYQPNQQRLKAQDQQHRRHDQRLYLPVAGALQVEVEKAQPDQRPDGKGNGANNRKDA